MDDEYTPDENDAYLSPTGPLGSRTSLSYDGKHVGTYDSDEDALAALREIMERDGYYPNVWTVSDHGNVHGPISV